MDYLQLMQNRSSIRSYLDKEISKKDLSYILECARLSPSSLGLEPWRFLIFQNKKHKKEISQIANNQAHVQNCAAIVVVLARADFKEYFEEKMKKKKLSQEKIDMYLNIYKPFIDGMNLEQSFAYAREQCHIASTNIINATFNLNLGACIIGGFDQDKINQYLKLDTNKQRVSLLITLGYPSTEIKGEKFRFDFNEVVEFKD